VQHPFPVLPSRTDRRSGAYLRNHAANSEAVTRLARELEAALAGGGEAYNERHQSRGKLLPRDRIELLLDRDSPFLELCPLAGHGIRGTAVGGSVVGGIGRVSGVECLVTANESTVKGGAINEVGLQKSLRLAEVALANRLPSIALTESAGADLPNQSKIFVPGGATFRGLTQRSKARIPTICVVFGSSTAGGAYLPGMSDYVVMVDKQAQVYLAGPPLVKMATGEETDHESLGGARMHSEVSGVSDYLAADERDAIRLAREIVSHLDWHKPWSPQYPVDAPVYDPDELLGIASADVREPMDAREIIARVVDGSRFSEFKPRYGATLVCGWARVHGYPVAILANQGTLFSESANKGAQFIQLANQTDTPLVFLQNTTGFIVGTQYEREGIIKNGAKLINAVSNSEVPAITIMTGASFGAGNYAMSGRSYQPRFLFTWPNHRIGVMGSEQLAGVLEIIQREAAARKGEAIDERQLEVAKTVLQAQMTKEADPYFATARLWDDGIIDPRDTRTVVALALSAIANGEVSGTTSWGVFRH
jgi:acetyl-CoA carboxylase carboxyltransferase component